MRGSNRMENMSRLLLRWLFGVISLVVASYAVSLIGFRVEIDTDQPVRLFAGVLLLGLFNATIGTIAKAFTFPLILLTFGLFAILINAALFYWVGSLGIGFTVAGFLDAVACSLAMGFVNQFFSRWTK